MTIATMTLTELAEKGADIDGLRQMVQFMVQRLMELDVEGRCGAGYNQKTPERLNSRNVYRDRTWDTPAGNVELKTPSYARAPLPRVPGAPSHGREELTVVIQEANVHGVSTRSVGDLIKASGMWGVSRARSAGCGPSSTNTWAPS